MPWTFSKLGGMSLIPCQHPQLQVNFSTFQRATEISGCVYVHATESHLHVFSLEFEAVALSCSGSPLISGVPYRALW